MSSSCPYPQGALVCVVTRWWTCTARWYRRHVSARGQCWTTSVGQSYWLCFVAHSSTKPTGSKCSKRRERPTTRKKSPRRSPCDCKHSTGGKPLSTTVGVRSTPAWQTVESCTTKLRCTTEPGPNGRASTKSEETITMRSACTCTCTCTANGEVTQWSKM